MIETTHLFHKMLAYRAKSGGRLGHKVYARSWISYILFIDALFIIAPLPSILLQVVMMIYVRSRHKLLYYNFIVTISIFLGLINTTKVPQSDMINYLAWFEMARWLDFREYIFMLGKEPIYHAFVYLIHYVFGGSKNWFIISVTSLGYILILPKR